METTKKGFLNMDIYHMPMKIFLPIAIVICVVGFTGHLPTDVFSTMIFLMCIGIVLQWFGNNTPILGKYCGLGGILPLFGASLLVTTGIVSEPLKLQCKAFVGDTLVPFQIGILLCGAIIGKMDRNVLKKAIVRYVPVIIVGEFFACVGCYMVGRMLGYNLFESVVCIAFPCFTGGSGGAMTQIPILISSQLGIDGNSFSGYMMAGLSLANIEAILIATGLDVLGKVKPSLTGNGILVRNKDNAIDVKEEKRKFSGSIANLQLGIFLSGVLVIFGYILQDLFKPIFDLNYIVWTIVLCLIIKIAGLFPEKWEDGMSGFMDMMLGFTLPALIAGMGIGNIDLVSTFSAINGSFFVLVTVTVVCFILGSMLGGYIVGFYPVESGISVGCCSVNIGGTGDLLICQATDRMELYPFASLSTRLGRAIALAFLGVVLTWVTL